jgi:hypothetical protein
VAHAFNRLVVGQNTNLFCVLYLYRRDPLFGPLRAFEHFNALELFAAKNTRLIVFIFASDERAAMMSAHQIITTFDSHADYVIVENPARFTSGVFFHSKLPDLLERFNAPTIQIPRITQTTIAILDDASKQLKKRSLFARLNRF